MHDLRNRQTILIVDDAPENIELLKSILEKDYQIKAAIDGNAALRICYSEAPPDLILLDIVMPGLSGHEVCRRLKANPDRRRIPVIFITAMDAMEDEQLGLEIGAVDYITKPISPAIVQARVRTHLALYDQARELERMVAQRTQELFDSRSQVILRLGRAAEFKDNETGNHVIRMSHYARLLGAAWLRQDADGWSLSHLCVRKITRCRGVGQRLIAAARQRAGETCQPLRLQAPARQLEVQALARRLDLALVDLVD